MTLIEVLVAFVILSLSMGVIMQIFFGGMRNARLAEGYSRAVFLAESKLAAVGIEQPLISGETAGEFKPDLSWRVIVTPSDDPDTSVPLATPVQLYQVRVVVKWSDEGRARQVELGSLRLGPRP